MTAIFVTEREPIEEVFDRDESDTFKVRGATGTDASEELQRRRKETSGHGDFRVKD